MRTFDYETVNDAVLSYYGEIRGFNPSTWLSDLSNIALIDDVGNLALFEEDYGVYNGHYFFISRGKQAVAAAKAFLKEIFIDYDAKVIRGLTPTHNKAALWMSRHLGFTSLGKAYTHEECELFLLTKTDWEKN